jgi:NAD(P)-dependent dehydrogenase (short-subunit alcohol dehydrogenase family)
MDPKGKCAIVTGGASGLGKATVLRFVDQGAKVVIVDMNGDAGQALADDHADSAVFAQCDVTITDQVTAAVQLAVERFGQVNMLVNCAGVGAAERTIGRRAPHDFDLFKWVVGVNLFGTFDMVRQAAFEMAKNEPDEDGCRGVIVNTSSVAAYDGQIGQASYSASKAGVVGMTLPIARDLSSMGIRICTICPGIFDTPLLAALPEDFRQRLGESVPFPKRLGQPDEYAQLAEQIVRNGYMNGEVIRLDGGIRMAPK